MVNKETASGKIFDQQIIKRIFRFVKPYQGRFYLLIFLTVALGVAAPIRPYLIQKMVDNEIANGDFEGLTVMMFVLIGIAILQSLIQFSHTYLSGLLGQNIIRDMRVELYQHILKLRLKFFDHTPIGRLVTRTVSDIETLAEVFTNGLAAIMGDLLQLIFIVGLMFYTNWRLTLVSLATLPILLVSTYIFKEKIKVAFNEVRAAVSNLNTFVQERITGMAILQIFNAEEREYTKFKDINKEHLGAHLKTVKYYSIYFPVAEIVAATGTGLLVWFGAREVLMNEGVTLGVLIAFIMYISMFFRPIRMIADRFNSLQMGIVSSDRILKLLDNTEHIPENGSLAPEHVTGNVQFENVWFAYNEENHVLKDISFQVKKGETIAFVGATGAGKSSIINLLNRFYEYNKGCIRLDGEPIRDYNLDNLRKHIAVVLQDVFLFSDTIYNNITLNNPAISRQQVIEAAESVGAKEFIERLPGGFDYNVMERGATLSVGQRQLISFVRAMVYNPKIIVLDEATSSVDTETEELIQSAIEKMMRGRTSIVIAHRLATIQKADQIIVLEKGEIKEFGKHEELLAKKGFYAKLHQMQFKEVPAVS